MSLRAAVAGRPLGGDSDAVTLATVYLALASIPLGERVAQTLARRVASEDLHDVAGLSLLTQTWTWVFLGMIAVGVAYAHLRGGGMSAEFPDRPDAPTVGLAFVGPVAVAVALGAALETLPGASVADTTDFFVLYGASPEFLLRDRVVPGLLVGAGYGTLFHGAIQEHLRDRFGATEAAVSVAVLAGLYHWGIDPTFEVVRSNRYLLLPLVLVVGTSYAAVVGVRLRDAPSPSAALTPTRAVAVASAWLLAFFVALDLISGATTAVELLVALAWFAAFGIAALVHERLRSVPVTSLSVAVFQVALFALPHLAAAAGLAATK